jgi:flagellar biosynthesis chaperone FliJ
MLPSSYSEFSLAGILDGSGYGTSTVQLDISDISEHMRLHFMSVMKQETNLLKLKDKKLKQIEYQEVRYDVKIKDEVKLNS